MSHKPERIYGYIMDIFAVIRFAVRRKPEFADLIKSHTFNLWQLPVLSYTVYTVGLKVDIPDIFFRVVWIGNGMVACCWELPDRFGSKHLSDNDQKRLRNLQTMLGNVDVMPRKFVPYEEKEPEQLKDVITSDHVTAQSLAEIIRDFNADGEAMLKKIMLDEDTQSSSS